MNDKPAIAIRVASKGHKDVTLAFDKQSHLMVKIEHRTLESGSGMEVNEEPRDYRIHQKQGRVAGTKKDLDLSRWKEIR